MNALDAQELGTEDLEAGMRPSRSRAFGVVLSLTLVVLLVFNSAGLVEWSQRLPSGQATSWLAERAAGLDRLVSGPFADVYKWLKSRLKVHR
jgi:hypothetical protein